MITNFDQSVDNIDLFVILLPVMKNFTTQLVRRIRRSQTIGLGFSVV
jgi:hypothetical protein